MPVSVRLFCKSGIVVAAATPFLAVMPFLCPRSYVSIVPRVLGWLGFEYFSLATERSFVLCLAEWRRWGCGTHFYIIVAHQGSLSTCFLWLHRQMLSGRDPSCSLVLALSKACPFHSIEQRRHCKVTITSGLALASWIPWDFSVTFITCK